MARARRPRRAETYRHDEEALLRPEVGTQAQFRKRKAPKTYRYDSSLSPVLDWDGQNSAHELGHWVCQCLEGRTAPVYCRAEVVGLDSPARAVEREANVFAAELVMPEERVRKEWHRVASAAELAEWFGVSAEAMTWRLYSFGLVEEPPR